MTTSPLGTAVVAAAAIALSSPAPAQSPRMDSISAMSAALTAQRVFERVRLANMPYGPSASRSGRCDEYIGRFCYTYTDKPGVPDEEPIEAEEVKRARAKLIEKLDSLSEAPTPGDWVVGMLVRYRLEAKEGEAALRGLSECNAAAWWCSALRGFVAHRLDRHVEAERAFNEARAFMDTDTRCEWDDLAPLLPVDARAEYNSLPCAERLRITRNGWWLAQPLFSRAGNDRRSEHDSRKVLQRLSETGLNPTWLRWGDDMTEILTRFGWPSYWRRYWSTMGDPNGPNPQITQYHDDPSYHFLPTLAAMKNPAGASEADWEIEPKISREEYSPSGVTFGAMDQQTARFLRGDSLLLVSRVSVAADSILGVAKSFSARIATVASPDRAALVMMEQKTTNAYTAQTRLRNTNWIASVEVTANVTPDSVRAARARFGAAAIVPDAMGHAMSDIMLFDVKARVPEDFASAVSSMRSSMSIRSSASVGVFWELYGLSRNDRVEVELSAVPEERGFFRRLGEALRLVSRERTVRIQWPETATESAPVIARAVALNHASLKPGWYTLRLSVVVNSGAPIEASRRIEIVR